MPIHDWTRVDAGIFHDFHLSWIAELKRTLNDGVLPPDYYALAEQIAGGKEPDVLALNRTLGPDPPSPPQSGQGIATKSPPRTQWTGSTDAERYIRKQRTLVIRHVSGDRVVALVEIVSPGNKSGRGALSRFVTKVTDAISLGYHFLIVDLFPSNTRAPNGVHGIIWDDLSGEDSYVQPPDKPLTLAAYQAGPPHTAYVEPVTVGESLTDMPLYLERDEYVMAPLERTYMAAWLSVPARWREVLE